MKLAMAFLAGVLCATMVLLVAAQAPQEHGRYQIASGGEATSGWVFQLDTYTGRLYARDWNDGRVYDFGTLDQPFVRKPYQGSGR